MSKNNKRLSRSENMIIVAMVVALIEPPLVPLIFPPASVDITNFCSALIVTTLWVGGLLLSVKRHEIVNSSLWNWLPPLWFFRKADPGFRPFIARGLAYLQIVIIVLLLTHFWIAGSIHVR